MDVQRRWLAVPAHVPVLDAQDLALESHKPEPMEPMADHTAVPDVLAVNCTLANHPILFFRISSP